MKRLATIKLKTQYYDTIREEIERLFDELIYAPLAALINAQNPGHKVELQNSDDPVADAVKTGKISYQDGKFSGEFNAAISKRLRAMGAKYDARSKSWSIPTSQIPASVSLAAADAQSRISALQASIIRALDSINIDSVNQISDIPDKYLQTIDWIEEDFQRTVRAVTIAPELTAAQRGIIAAEWGQNLDLYIKDWMSENILKLREEVMESAFSGQRAKELAKVIQSNYAVSRRKAQFLARQETSLLVSKFRETRYKDVGSNRYIWRGAMDERERPDHKALQGKVFFWDSPPVVDRRTGRRGHPGEDFGCRCVAVAVID
jgi:SPP1 gp7 family putative phage head morphogenesis protein